MINLYNSDITDILPEVLGSNEKSIALGYAIKQAMQRFVSYCQNISVYAVIDTVPEEVLDMLAVELKTQYYDDSMAISIKRSLVKNTLVWYMYTGTTAAVTELVEAVFGNSEIEEWFEYGGEPYHFKIRTSNINSTDEMIQQVMDLIRAMQNVRSHLEEVTVEVMQQMRLYHGCVIEAIADTVTIGINMEIEDDDAPSNFIRFMDSSTGTVYEIKVVDGSLTMETADGVSSGAKNLLLADANTGTVYELKVVDGALAMTEGSGSSAKDFILLVDANTGAIYEISVVDGDLVMK